MRAIGAEDERINDEYYVRTQRVGLGDASSSSMLMENGAAVWRWSELKAGSLIESEPHMLSNGRRVVRHPPLEPLTRAL